MSEFYGITRGSVYDVADPEKRGRVRLLVPAALGESPSGWAEPTLPPSFGYVPTVGDRAFVLFEGGDINKPTFISKFEVTTRDLSGELGGSIDEISESVTKVFRQDTEPGPGPFPDNSLWYNTSDNNVLSMWDADTNDWILTSDPRIINDPASMANLAAAIAASEAATGTAITTSANGKNKVTYSTGVPGSTPNTAGDVWFQRSGAMIISQWEGQGGTTWAQRTIAGTVIAYLDAGSITAGTAFANALSVKTTFTLGDASTDGVIQSYNFASASTGIYISKSGLYAKGGSIIGTSVATAGSGNRMVMEQDGSAGVIKGYTGLSGEFPTTINPFIFNPGGQNRPGLSISSGTTGSAVNPASLSLLTGNSGTGYSQATLGAAQVIFNATSYVHLDTPQVYVDGAVDMGGNTLYNVTMGAGSVGTGTFRDSVDARVTALSTGLNQSQVDARVNAVAPTVTMTTGSVGTGAFRTSVRDNAEAKAASGFASGITVTGGYSLSGGGSINGGAVLNGSPTWTATGTGDTANVAWNGGQMRPITSSARYKTNIRDLDVNLDAVYGFVGRRYERVNEDEPNSPEIGFIAEEALEAGLDDWVMYNDAGQVESFDYFKYVVALQAAVRDLNKRVRELEASAA